MVADKTVGQLSPRELGLCAAAVEFTHPMTRERLFISVQPSAKWQTFDKNILDIANKQIARLKN